MDRDDYIAGWQAGKIEINTKQHKEYISFIYIFIYIRVDLFIYWYNVCACTLTKIINKNKKIK